MISLAKSLTNKNLTLTAKEQEVSTYSKLFSNINNFSLKDSKEVLSIKTDLKYSKYSYKDQDKKLLTLNKYPSIQFSGF
ncbi:MAG: hypothetical protein HYY52_03320 [Candidatus Melainabacteria bacterium]|nr:hypothetical protein [Candidatus Melainabacteria bacterium]